MLTGDNRDNEEVGGRILLTGSGSDEHIMLPEVRDILDRADVIVYDASAGVGAFTGPVPESAKEAAVRSNASVHVIDGRLRPDGTCGIDFVALTEAEGTLVFLPGSGSFSVIVDGLMSAGMDPDIPAMIIETGQAGPMRIIPSTLSELKDSAKQAKALLPAVIVVGDSYLPEEQPEEGPGEQTGESGAFDFSDAIRAAARDLRNSRYEWIVFADEAGVSLFMDALLEICDIRSLAYCRIAAAGSSTAEELGRYGIRADLVTPEDEVRRLAVHFRKGDRVLVTGPAEECSSLEEEFRSVRGVECIALPTHDI